MKILMTGTGVLGSLYAARLQETGRQVTVLARGQRLQELQQNGILLEDETSGKRTCTQVQVIDALAANASYDLAMVLVRNNQLASVLPVLAANTRIPVILFMVNQACEPQALIDAVGKERVLLGFPGAGAKKMAPWSAAGSRLGWCSRSPMGRRAKILQPVGAYGTKSKLQSQRIFPADEPPHRRLRDG